MYCIVAIHPPCIYVLCHNKRHIFFSLFLINFRLYYNEQLVSIWNMSMTSYSLCVTKTHVLVFNMTLYLCPILCTSRLYIQWLGIVKKQKKLRKSEKNNWKNQTMRKNRLKFWKNQPVRFGFGFISLKLKKMNQTQTEKTGKNRAKTEKTEPNRFEPVFILKNQTEQKPVGLNRV